MPHCVRSAIYRTCLTTIQSCGLGVSAGGHLEIGDVDSQGYKPGSETARLMLAGAGSVQLEMAVELVDSGSGKTLVQLPIDRTRAWGGVLGASRGIEEMERNVAYELGLYLQRSRARRQPRLPRRHRPSSTEDGPRPHSQRLTGVRAAGPRRPG